MSELNEDILNYEIGDVDADDTDLTGADEDELLLSDDESFSERLAPNQEDDDLLSTQPSSESAKQIESTQSDQHLEHLNKNDNVTQYSDDVNQKSSESIENRTETDEPVVMVTPVIQTSNSSKQHSGACISPESDLVSSTNKEDDDEIASQPTQSQSEQKDSDPSYASTDEQSENTVYEDSEEISHSQNDEQTDDQKSESEPAVVVSQDVSEENNDSSEQTVDDYDADDGEDVRERRNPKTCVERETPHQQFEENNRPKQFPHNNQRYRHTRPQMPRPNHPPYGMPPGGPDFNPSFMPQYRGGRPRGPMPPVSQADFIRGHPMMRGGPPNHMQRMPPGMGPPPRMPGGPLLGPGPPHQRLQRPPFQTPPNMFGNNPGMPPQGMIRPRGPPNAHQMMPPQRSPFVPYSQPNHPANMRLPMNPSMSPHAPPMNAAIPNAGPSIPLPLIGAPRKVLINPNFKGGVQAATNQLMLDTMKNSQILENKREEELLRQQEAFINQNRLHIEKRRRSREHSPERDYRDRDRSRSYSPPRRRERDGRKPYPPFRDNRARRANSRDRENPEMKRKRFEGDNNPEKNDPKTDEDEETRAYRLEIEKQKAQREKILRDKEMRRRKAAEELKKDEGGGKQPEVEKKVAGEEQVLPQKFTPLIVTQKKIISLKKKPSEGASEQSQKPKTVTLTRKVAASVEHVSVQSGSQLKATLRTSSSISSGGGVAAKKLRIDDDIDESLEDELLADSPPATPAPDAALKSRMNAATVGEIPTSMFTNRRIVVRNSADNVPNNENNLTTSSSITKSTSSSTAGKGIFDRLEKKVIGVNEAAKRKIQRIVINNSSE